VPDSAKNSEDIYDENIITMLYNMITILFNHGAIKFPNAVLIISLNSTEIDRNGEN